jgi:hypothetical protein
LSIEKVKLLDIQRIKIYNLTEEDSFVKDFLEHCMPNSLQILTLNHPSGPLIKSGYYLDSLGKTLKAVSKEIFLKNFEFNKEELEIIVKASSGCERLIIRYCKIEAEQEFDFSGPQYQTSYLGFSQCGHKYKNNWDTHNYRFENIVKGIKKSQLKDSLSKIDVHSTYIRKSIAQEILNQHGLNGITAIEEDPEPMT